MATTYELISSQTLGSDTASVTFSSIPQTFDDLALICSARTDASSGGGVHFDNITIRFNGDTGSNYSTRSLYGYNGSATSDSHSGTYIQRAYATSAAATASTFGNTAVLIPNYAGAANKSVSISGASESNSANDPIIAVAAGLWSSTSAITSVGLIPANGTNFVTGSSFYLYGITKA